MLLARYETQERLEVFDERGAAVGSVTLPRDAGLFGPERGTVFLNRAVPAAKTPEKPAQAA